MDLSRVLDSSLDLAGHWFLQSGIQEQSGGVARYYYSDRRCNARVSTEITGYSIGALVYLARQTGDAAYLDAAERGARFLCRTAWDRELSLFPFEHSIDGGTPKHLAYFFDSGIIARGLLAVWRATRRDEYLETAAACGEHMLRDFVRDGTVHPIVALPSREALPHSGNWSHNSGCYQLKAALAWYELHEAGAGAHFLDAYEGVLASSLETHTAFLPGEPDRYLVMDRLHAYSYFFEGMLPRYDRPACRDAVRQGIARAAGLLREIAPSFERSDVCAQILRARLYAGKLGACALDHAAAADEAARMTAYQMEDGDPRIHGGFWFGRKDGALLPFVNPVSTAFCLQALAMWREFEAGEFSADRYELI